MTSKCPRCGFENPEDTLYCGKCASPLKPGEEVLATETLETPKEELNTGSTFAGRYQIIEELGKGGMGKVYKVHDTEIREKVALKLLKPEIAADEKTIDRFRNEIKLARKIAHRNVCKMYDLGDEKGTRFITMEYVEGEDLRGTIRRIGQLPIGKSISIAKQVCEGLAEAHRLGVIHRDLKPSNIIIDREGNARIMDFGIARSREGKGITDAGVMIGTPEYMSPEQVEGKEVDQRSDIYSLGVILYEMVTGKVPFEGDTPFTIGMKHKSEMPKDPRELNTQLPEDLSRVILRCMEKDKDKRYQSAGEVRSELVNIEEGIPTTERVVPERKPLTSREITVTVGLKKLLIPGLVVAAIIIAAVIIWQLFPERKAAPIPSDKPSLAVLYFENNTGDSGLDHYRKAVSDLLITDLSQSKYIQVLSGARLFNILNKLNKLETRTYSSEVLKEVATRGSVEYVLIGSYSKAGDLFRLNYSLLDANTSTIIGSEAVEGRGEESIFSMVDDLTKRIKANLKLSEEKIASDFDMDVGEITTSSPEAYKYYSEGARYDHLGQYKKSIELMEKAIELDPDFAMAYRSMGVTFGDMRYYSKQKEYLQKALELSNRVSIRERYQIQGDYYWMSETTYDKAIEAYSKLLKLYPEDTNANINLGVIYRDLEEWDKARERLEVLRQAKDESIFPYMNLAIIAMAKESYDEAKEILEYYLKNISDNVAIHLSLARNYIYQGKLDLALSEVDKSFILSPDNYYHSITRGDIYQYRGDLIEAEKEYQELLKAEEPRAHYEGLRRLATLYLLQGKYKKAKEYVKQAITWAEDKGEMVSKTWAHAYLALVHSASRNHEQALKELDESWSTAVASDLAWYQRYNYYWRGLVFVEMSLFGKTQEAAEEFKARVDKGMNKKEIRYYYDLMGKLALGKGNFSNAIEYINKALPMEPYGPLNKFVWPLDTLALAYYKAGYIKKAQEEYERIIKLTTGRLWRGDIYAKSFYMLGKIYEQQDNKAKAIQHYSKFLSLWKDADPGLPEVEDAKKSLVGLKDRENKNKAGSVQAFLMHLNKNNRKEMQYGF